MSTLAQWYDALFLGLDGTVYLGGQPIHHIAPALGQGEAAGCPVGVRHEQRIAATVRGGRIVVGQWAFRPSPMAC